MKALKIIKYTFTIIGTLMLIGSFFILKNTNDFLKTSISSQGTVIDMSRSNSSDNSTTYAPVVEFVDKKGHSYEFRSSTSSNPPSYSIGEQVEIYYNPKAPNKAKIKGFFSLWGGGTIVAGLGFVFFAIGASLFLFDRKKKNLLKNLKLNGTRIDADFISININYSFSVNGRNPYQIITQWQNPSTSKLHIFKSDNIWFDPTDYITKDKIKVLIDKRNPKKYVVDLSFLPEVA